MSDLRNSTYVAVGPRDYTDYLDINKAIQELQSPHKPGLFILKPKDPPKDQSRESLAFLQGFNFTGSLVLLFPFSTNNVNVRENKRPQQEKSLSPTNVKPSDLIF